MNGFTSTAGAGMLSVPTGLVGALPAPVSES